MTEYKTIQSTDKEHTTFSTGSKRDNRNGKGRYDLISSIFLKRFAQHLENGIEFYEERNWERGQPLHLFIDSAIRHLYAYLSGARDEDHLTAAAWNIHCLIHTEEKIRCGELPAELNDLPANDLPTTGIDTDFNTHKFTKKEKNKIESISEETNTAIKNLAENMYMHEKKEEYYTAKERGEQILGEILDAH